MPFVRKTVVPRSRRGMHYCLRVVPAILLLVLVTLAGKLVPAGAAARGIAVPSGTFVLGGSMSSDSTLRMTGALAVGEETDLTWNLPRPRSLQIDGYQERVIALGYRFNVRPDSFSDVMVDGRPLRRFHWNAPPVNSVITVVERLRVSVRTRLSPFFSAAPYPLRGIPSDTTSYLQMTPNLQLPPSVDTVVAALRAGKTTEKSVVNGVADWVAMHTQYNAAVAGAPLTASWVLASHQATCRGFGNLMAGLLRRLGIPVQVEYGWVLPQSISLPVPSPEAGTMHWGVPASRGELHTWLNVYFPDRGWVPFDPQAEKFFVDPLHVALMPNVDAGNPVLGTWSAHLKPGASLADTQVYKGIGEVIPGDGIASKVSLRTRLHYHLRLRKIERDVQNIVLFAR